MKTSITITSIDQNEKKSSKALTNINPNISNETLKQAAQLFVATTDKTFYDADRINKININEEYAGQKTEPTLTVDNSGNITYNGDGTLFGRITTENGQYLFLKIYNNQLSAKNDAGNTITNFSGEIYASAGTTYASKSTTFTVGG